MVAGIDQDVLAGFIEEARNYLPVISLGIDGFTNDPEWPRSLETTHRYCHNIKGAASMIGLHDLSQIAFYLEEIVEAIMAGELSIDSRIAAQMHMLVSRVESCLDSLARGELPETALLEDASEIHHEVVASLAAGTDTRGFPPPDPVEPLAPDAVREPERSVPGGIRVPAEAVPLELLEVFSVEAEDHLQAINLHLADLEKNPEDLEALQEIRRRVHTLKGAAAAMGFSAISQLSHRMEDMLDRLNEGGLSVEPVSMQLLFESSDALESLAHGGPAADEILNQLPELYARFTEVLEEEPATVELANYELVDDEPLIDFPKIKSAAEDGEGSEKPGTKQASLPRIQGDVIRVPLERLDELVRLVSELVITRSAFEQRMAEFSKEVDELQLSNDRLQRVSLNLDTKYEVSALGGRLGLYGGRASADFAGNGRSRDDDEFDELQFDRYTEFHILTRELVETASDLRTIGFELTNTIGDFDGLVNRQARLSTQIQNKLMRTRMVPLATLTARLHRTVRVLSGEQGKLVDLVIEGESIEIDTTVLDSIVDPLIHLMRNAVDHGIEYPEGRRSAGKSERGTINLRAFYEGSNVVIQVIDDGQGLDRGKIVATAIDKGLISPSNSDQISDEELNALIFSPGFSTASQVSEVSGRGVGLEIVKNNVEKLNGVVFVESAPGEGTSHTIRLPMTLAVIQALLVRANHETFAIPLGAVTQILRLEHDEIERIGSEAVLRLNDRVYPMHKLGDLLNLTQPPDATLLYQPVVILNVGAEHIALVVDQLLTGREIVVKSLGNHLRRIHGIMGATLMGDGSVVLIVNPVELLSTPTSLEFQPDPVRETPTSVDNGSLQIMVVDDSLSVRTVVSNLVRSVGWEPVAVRDGLEALEHLQQAGDQPDLILVDIEMPRMDGYELMSTLKANTAFEDIPLVVLSSRAGPKHRQRAMEIGAADYIVKPYKDAEMIDIIQRLVRESSGVMSE